MHGIPESWVNVATREQLDILWEIVKRDTEEGTKISSISTANGIGMAFGGDK